MVDSSTSIKTESVQATHDLGRRLGAVLEAGDLVALEGDLGSGKTVLVQGIAEALGVTATVHSPTFVLHHRYPGRVPVDHYDLYRLQGVQWRDAGLDEPAPDSVTVVEWSDRAGVLDAWSNVRIRLEVVAERERRLTILKGPDRVRALFDGQTPRT
jgi:tRNA threonylcarbamoyladenosine biosynthesis protein TsaE